MYRPRSLAHERPSEPKRRPKASGVVRRRLSSITSPLSVSSRHIGYTCRRDPVRPSSSFAPCYHAHGPILLSIGLLKARIICRPSKGTARGSAFSSISRPSSGLGRLRYGAPDLPTCPIQGILGPHQEESGRSEPRPQPLSRIFAASRTPRWPGSLGYILTPWRSTWPSRPHPRADTHEEDQRPCALGGLHPGALGAGLWQRYTNLAGDC